MDTANSVSPNFNDCLKLKKTELVGADAAAVYIVIASSTDVGLPVV